MTKSVLVIDDSSLARRTLRHILESAAYQVDEANDALAGLERYALAKGDYAIVFLDNVMAGMYGMDAILKFKELNPRVQIILATADIQDSTRQLAMDLGVFGLINKPLSRTSLLKMAEAAIAQAESF